MFNRDGMRQPSVSPHNIYETMSRSRKRMPGSTWCCCKSQKKGKQASSRKFRRKAHVLLHQGKHHLLPLKSFEVMSPRDSYTPLLKTCCFLFLFLPETFPVSCGILKKTQKRNGGEGWGLVEDTLKTKKRAQRIIPLAPADLCPFCLSPTSQQIA